MRESGGGKGKYLPDQCQTASGAPDPELLPEILLFYE